MDGRLWLSTKTQVEALIPGTIIRRRPHELERVDAAYDRQTDQRCAINQIASLRTAEGGVLDRSVGWDEQQSDRFLLAAAAELVVGTPVERRG